MGRRREPAVQRTVAKEWEASGAHLLDVLAALTGPDPAVADDAAAAFPEALLAARKASAIFPAGRAWATGPTAD